MEEKPGSQLTAFENEGIVEIIITGELKEGELEGLQDEVTAIIANAGCGYHVIIDVRALKGYFCYSEVFFHIRQYPREIYQVNMALVDVPENADFQTFQERTSTGAGMNFKWFNEVDAARTWLRSLSVPGNAQDGIHPSCTGQSEKQFK